MLPSPSGRHAAFALAVALIVWSRAAHADPTIQVLPPAVNFGTVSEGTASAAQTITVRNTGSVVTTLTLSGATISPTTTPTFQFTSVPQSVPPCIGGTSCTFQPTVEILSGGTRTLAVQCAPPEGTVGQQTAVLTIASNATNAGANTVNLICTSFGPPPVPASGRLSLAVLGAGLAAAGVAVRAKRRRRAR
jgi:hypothetical protein